MAIPKPLPADAELMKFIANYSRGVAVFTRGLNLDFGNGTFTSAEWPANDSRIAVSDCFVLYYRTDDSVPLVPTLVYVGTITSIERLPNGFHRYTVSDYTVTALQNVNWKQFTGSQSRIRYFQT